MLHFYQEKIQVIVQHFLPESANVTTEGCLKVFSRLTALLADTNLSVSEQTKTETGLALDLRVPRCKTKTPAPRVKLLSTGVPSSQEKLVAEPFDHQEENILTYLFHSKLFICESFLF
jgi:hypothetical protein